MMISFHLYHDPFGLIGIKPNEPTDNGVLFTAEAMICIINCGVNGQPYWYLWQEYMKAINSCNEPQYGIMCRQPNDLAYNSMDNYTARLALAIMNNTHTTSFDDFGVHMKNNYLIANSGIDDSVPINKSTYLIAKILGLGHIKYCYNPSQPTKYCFAGWYGRSPAILAMMDIAATGTTSFFREACLFVSQMMGAYTPVSNLDGRKLSYVAWQALKGRNKFWAWGYRHWCKKLMKDYNNGMETVYCLYYGENHPLTNWTHIYTI